MDSAAGHEASDDESDHKYQLDGTDTSKAEAALKAKLSRKRTKTGCLTCRKRRIKCGEERPMCKNCIKSKRHCEGYSQRVVFKPPHFEYRAAPNGGAHITFQAGPMTGASMLSMHPGQMPQYWTDPNVYPNMVPQSDQQFMQYVQQPVSSFAPPAPLMQFPSYGMPLQPVAVSHAVPLGYNPAMNGHQQQQAQPQFQTPFVPTYNDQLQQQQAIQTPFTPARTQSIPTSSQALPTTHFQTPTQIPRAYSVAEGTAIPQVLPAGNEQSWPNRSVPNVAPVSQATATTISPPRKYEPMSAPISLNASQAWTAPTYTPRPELSYPIDYRPTPTTSEVPLRQPVAIPPPSMPALAAQNLSDPPTPEFFEQQAQFPENPDYSKWLAEAAVEVVDDDYWDVESDEDMDIDKPTTVAQDTKRQRTLNKVLMGQHFDVPSLQIRRYDTFLQEGMLERYRVEWHANPLRNPATARVFAHFISATGPSMSPFERNPVNSSVLFTDGSVPLAQQGLWTYTMPMAALHHQGLLHAMLALSSLHIARLQNGDTTPSMKHYAWALKRIHNCVSSRDSKKRLRATTIAASMLLGFYEVMTADHMKWNTHLAGAKQLFVETDFAGMTRQYRQLKREKMARDQLQLRRNSISTFFNREDDIPNQFNDVDEAMISNFVGREVRYEDPRGYVETEQTRIPQELDLSNFEILKDLFWWYCKQDAYQSIVSGNPLLMDYTRWSDCPPRASMGRADAVYGSFDHLILLLGRIADFASKDRVRKLRQMALQGGQWIPAPGMNIPRPPGAASGPRPSAGAGAPQGPPSGGPTPQAPPTFFGMAPPPRSNVQMPSSYNPAHQEMPSQNTESPEAVDLQTATAAALVEYGKIRAALKAFVAALNVPAFQPLAADLQTPIPTPFGPAIFYRSYDIGCLWSIYNMCEIIAIRSHPHMHPAAHAAAGLAAKDTTFYAEQIGRIAAGIVPGPANEPLNPTLGSSLCESCMPSFFAAIQYQRPDQRHFTVMRIYGIALRTGWGSAELIGKGIETSWVKAGEMGRGPPYQRVEMPRHSDDPRLNHSWELRTDPNTKPEEMDDSDRRLVNIKANARLNWAIGVIGTEDDVGK